MGTPERLRPDILPPFIFVITNQSGDQAGHAKEAALDTLVERIAAREDVAGHGLPQ